MRNSRPSAGRGGRRLDGGAAAQPLELHQQVRRLREREQLLDGVEGDAAHRPRERLVPDDLARRTSLTMGWKTARTSALDDEAGELLAAHRLHPLALDEAHEHGLRHRLLDGALAAHDGVVLDAGVAGGEPQGAQHAGRAERDSMRARMRGQQAVAPRGARWSPVPAGHEDEEAVRAHGVQAHDVLRAELARRPQRGQDGGELADRAVVGGPAELGLVAARPAEVDVDDVGRARWSRGCGARPRPPRAARAAR